MLALITAKADGFKVNEPKVYSPLTIDENELCALSVSIFLICEAYVIASFVPAKIV